MLSRLTGVKSQLNSSVGAGALDAVLSLYFLIGALLGVYVAFLSPGAIPLTVLGLVRDLITVLLYTLLWPFFLFGNLRYRIS
jgi:hypothetical protein